MRLHHTVNTVPNEWRVTSILKKGLVPQVADAYRDLVPEKIRHLPVVWFSEGIWQSKELPVFGVNSEDLVKDSLYQCTDTNLHWWVYQGYIPADLLYKIKI